MKYQFQYLPIYKPLWNNAANKVRQSLELHIFQDRVKELEEIGNRSTDDEKEIQSAKQTIERISEKMCKFIFLQGGSGSGKTIQALTLALSYMANTRNFECIVLRKTLNECRKTVFKDAENAADFAGQKHLFTFSGGETGTMLVRCPSTNSTMHFMGVDDPEKIKGIHAGIQLLIVDELTGFRINDLKQMNIRLRCPKPGALNQIICTFNPIDKANWVYKEIIEKGMFMDNALYMVTTYRHNPKLPKEYVQAIEDLIQDDPVYAECYAFGNWINKFEGVIYKDWQITTYKRQGRSVYGLDFGDVHPCALVEVNIRPKLSRTRRGELHVRQHIYESELPIDKLIDKMRFVCKIPVNATIVCDGARSDLIKQIRKVYRNAIAADKGAGSVYGGIQIVKSFDLYVDEDSHDIQNELEGYRWKITRDGENTGQPVKKNDDAMDATRYATVYLTEVMKIPAIGIPQAGDWKPQTNQSKISELDQQIADLESRMGL